MKKLILTVIILPLCVSCMTNPITTDNYQMRKPPKNGGSTFLTSLIPGFTQFVNGEIAEGLVYSIGSAGFIIGTSALASSENTQNAAIITSLGIIGFYSFSFIDGIVSTASYRQSYREIMMQQKAAEEKLSAELRAAEEKNNESYLLAEKQRLLDRIESIVKFINTPIESPTSYTKDTAFLKTREWIALSFNSAIDVVQLEQRETGKLIVRAMNGIDVKYTLSLTLNDYKINAIFITDQYLFTEPIISTNIKLQDVVSELTKRLTYYTQILNEKNKLIAKLINFLK